MGYFPAQVKEIPMASKSKRPSEQVLGFLGVGLDNPDGHQRLTHTEHFFLVGGTEETHEQMQDVTIRFNEALKRRGKPLPELPAQEVVDQLHEAMDH
jgi:hypothetical protein